MRWSCLASPPLERVIVQHLEGRLEWLRPTGSTRLRASHFVLIGDATVRREPIDHRWQCLRKLRQQLVAGNTGLLRQLVGNPGAQRFVKLVGRDRLISAGAYPGVDDVAIAILLEALQQSFGQ